MKFTIFTAFYNYIDTFDELVNSVLSQTHTNWEWIIVNDFSENAEVEKKLIELENNSDFFWKIKRIHQKIKKEFYFTPPIKYATGDVIIVLDSDDIIHPKLLEVYNYNFNMFPNVQLISTNSIMRTDSINGSLNSIRYINYKNNKNLLEARNDLSFEYNYGDCRAWRNNIETFEPDTKWQFCSEDFNKILICEEKGELLYLPRTLCTYAVRENSISHKNVYGADLAIEVEEMIKNSNSRLDRSNLNTINKFYDNSYQQTTAFYLSNLNLEKIKSKIEYFSNCSEHDKEILKVLYFDHNLFFEKTNDIKYLIAKISNLSELYKLSERLSQGLPNKQLIVEVNLDISNETESELIKFVPSWYWFQFLYRTYIINF